jgi:hypothetical protein
MKLGCLAGKGREASPYSRTLDRPTLENAGRAKFAEFLFQALG